MLERIGVFERGSIRLGTLVDDLEGLLGALEAVASSWEQEFLSNWGVLEEARALALAEELKEFDEKVLKIILGAIGRLRLQVLEKISDPADRSRFTP
jgi:uncharacterized membrane protein